MHDIEKIYDEYFEAIYKYLLCLTHNSDISEELTQETFYRAVQKINSYKGNCEISVWLCQIAKHLWYDYCRKNKRILNLKESDLLNIQDIDSIDNMIILQDEKMSLYKKIQNLDEKTKEVMYLRLSGELTFKEIGIILNKSEAWARVTFYRGKIKLEEGDVYE